MAAYRAEKCSVKDLPKLELTALSTMTGSTIVIGLSYIGSLLVWIGLFFSIVCTLLRKKELETDKSFTNGTFWLHILIVIIFIGAGILASTLVVQSCVANSLFEDGFSCFGTRLRMNLLAPIPPLAVTCMLWRKMTKHKV
ncbi:MAG: hypothetical protein ABJM90_17540 [Paracoccaceae bacterium]